MSLQVWLPLNGDLHNLGLLDKPSAVVLQSGNSFTANGKIGQCLSSTNTNVAYFLDTSNNKLISLFNSGQIYTMAFWYKLTGNGTSGSIILIGTTTPSSGSGNGTFGFWWTNDNNGTNPRIVWNDGDNGKRILSKANDNSDIATDYTNWHHLVAIIDKTNMAALRQIFYIDGIKVRDLIYNNSSANALTITNANNYIYFRPYYALLNDIRIYDHLLSQKEIEELAKGLVLHYQLDNNGEGGRNLLLGTYNFANWYLQSRWTKNNNIATYIEGSKAWLDMDSPTIPWADVQGKTLTISADIRSDDFNYTDGSGFSICFVRKDSGPNATGYSTRRLECTPIHLTVNLITSEWKRYSATVVNISDSSFNLTFNGGGGDWFGVYIWNYTNKSVQIKNIKLEIGNKATYYSLAPEDFGLNGNIIYDSSGYNYNGSLLGAPIISLDTIRYNLSTFFDGNDDGILIENLELSNIINNLVTYSFWIKPSGENGARSVYFGSYSGTSWSIEKTAGNVLRSYWNGSPDITCTGATITDDIWLHVCIVKNGTSDLKVYINGEVKFTSTTTLNTLTFPTTYRIGRDIRIGETSYKGNMSDFRIYATALTEELVLDLYHTSGTIDNKGNVYAREFEENDQLNLTKTGIFRTSNIYDNDELTKASILKTDKQVLGNTLYEY